MLVLSQHLPPSLQTNNKTLFISGSSPIRSHYIRKVSYLQLVPNFSTTIVERMLFEPVQATVNIQEEQSFNIK